MLKKTITYDDLDGNKVTEDFYFNISKGELLEKDMSSRNGDGKRGYSEMLVEVAEARQGKEMLSVFKEILEMSVGQRSEDGRRFVKNQEIRDNFFQSDAYSVLFMELFTDATAASNFFKAIMPGDLTEGIDEEVAKVVPTVPQQALESAPEVVTEPSEPQDTRPAYMRESRQPTTKEIQNMTTDELRVAFAWKESTQKG
jgi:hypothetical protein